MFIISHQTDVLFALQHFSIWKSPITLFRPYEAKKSFKRQKAAASGLDKLGVTAARNREDFHMEMSKRSLQQDCFCVAFLDLFSETLPYFDPERKPTESPTLFYDKLTWEYQYSIPSWSSVWSWEVRRHSLYPAHCTNIY